MSKKQNKKNSKKKKRKNSNYKGNLNRTTEKNVKSSGKTLQKQIKDINVMLSLVLVVCALLITVVKVPVINDIGMIVLFVTLLTQQVLIIYGAYKEKSKSKIAIAVIVILAFAYLAYKVFLNK